MLVTDSNYLVMMMMKYRIWFPTLLLFHHNYLSGEFLEIFVLLVDIISKKFP